MDAADLRVFEAVARLGGMSRAAAELNTVQSNVTARIRQLEAELGVALFERSSRGAVATPAGQRLLPYAARVAQILDDAARAARDDGTPRGPLTIGTLETTAALRLSPMLARYVAAYPEVDLVLRTGTTAELVDAVLARRLEGAFVCGPIRHPDLAEEVFCQEELAVFTAPWVRSLDEIVEAGEVNVIVLRAGCSYRQRLEAMLARRGAIVQRHFEFGTLESILGCVSAGLGVALMPRNMAGAAPRDRRVAVHALPPEEARVDTVFISRRDTYVGSALQAFMRCARPMATRSAAE